MSVDPNQYDLDELRELADEDPVEEGPSEADFLWMGKGTPTADAPDDPASASRDAPDTDADRGDPVFASAIFEPRGSGSTGTAESDDTGWLDVPPADEVSGSD